jgi:hypothetical protein
VLRVDLVTQRFASRKNLCDVGDRSRHNPTLSGAPSRTGSHGLVATVPAAQPPPQSVSRAFKSHDPPRSQALLDQPLKRWILSRFRHSQLDCDYAVRFRRVWSHLSLDVSVPGDA